jgi:hypothetical protein
MQAIVMNFGSGKLEAASDPRGIGHAEVRNLGGAARVNTQ